MIAHITDLQEARAQRAQRMEEPEDGAAKEKAATEGAVKATREAEETPEFIPPKMHEERAATPPVRQWGDAEEAPPA